MRHSEEKNIIKNMIKYLVIIVLLLTLTSCGELRGWQYYSDICDSINFNETCGYEKCRYNYAVRHTDNIITHTRESYLMCLIEKEC